MPNRSSKNTNRQTQDFNQAAKAIVDFLAELSDEPPPKEKDPLAVELGRRGGLKGGKARAAQMTSEKRRERARNAAKKRWRKA